MKSKYLNDAALNQLIKNRRTLHQIPELSHHEVKTSLFIQEQLRSYGYQDIHVLGKTGVATVLEGKKSHPVILLRADMDALPIQEQTQVPFASKHDGAMHACGHDTHVAMLLAAARYFKQGNPPNCTLKFLFQPAEEGGQGALDMIEEGILTNPTVDAVFGIHIWAGLPVGTVGLKPGPLLAAVDRFSITIQGKGGHGGMPQHSHDPIIPAVQIISSLQTLVSRRSSPFEPVVVSVGSIHGGTAFNIIPDTIHFTGTVRTFSKAMQNFVEQEMRHLAHHICAAHHTECSVDYANLNQATSNHPHITQLVNQAITPLLKQKKNIHEACMETVGEDVSEYLERVPGCFMLVGGGFDDPSQNFPHHHPYFKINEEALPFGVDLFINVVHELENHDFTATTQ